MFILSSLLKDSVCGYVIPVDSPLFLILLSTVKILVYGLVAFTVAFEKSAVSPMQSCTA